MGSIKSVVVAGAGSLGKVLVKELLDAGISVTVFSRQESIPDLGTNVNIAKVDYGNVESLTKALKGHDALVSTITTGAKDQQSNLVDAAVAAGIKRFIPSEFGCDLDNPKTRALPAYGQNIQIQQDIEKKSEGAQMTYTYIYNNALLDWGIDVPFMMDLKGKKIDAYDGGNVAFTATPIPFVAAGVRAVLEHPDETANKTIRLHGAHLTMKKLLELTQGIVGKDGWEVTETRSTDLERESYENLKRDPSNVLGWIIGFFKCAAFGEGYGGDFSQNNDNQMLGLKAMSDEEVQDLVRSRA